MANNLMIVESPTKTKKLTSLLGSDWTVVATVGHIQDLPSEGGLGFDKDTLKIQYVLSKRGRRFVEGLKRIISTFDRVVIATDPDREGEAIAQHVKDALELGDRYERCTFNELTKAKVLNAVNNGAGKIDEDLVAAQESRRMLDRLVGWEFTAALTQYLSQLSPVGRVQSQVVKIIVNREQDCRDFIETKHYSLQATVGDAPKQWKANLNVKKSDLGQVVKSGHYCWTDENAALSVADKIKQFEVIESEKKITEQNPPWPLITSTLQQAALNALGFNSKKTDELAQKLFTSGHITYIRTDSATLSDEAFSSLSDYANEHGYPVLAEKRSGKKGVVAQEAHEAIRPSDFSFLGEGLSVQEKALYNLIWTTTMASQMKPATRLTTSTKLKAVVDGKDYYFDATGSIPQDKGWKVILEQDASEDSDESDEKDSAEEAKNPVPVLEVGDMIDVAKCSLVKKVTSPPTPFTEGTLGKLLEKEGIGKPSTYTKIYQKIGETGHKYVFNDFSKNKKKPFIRPHQRAFDMVGAIGDIFKIMDIKFTKKMEDDLDSIANGELEHTEFVKSFFKLVDEEIEHLQQKDGARPVIPCEKCGTQMVRMPNKNGKTWWWRCLNDDCDNTAQDLDGRPATAEDIAKLHAEKIAPFLNEDGTPKHPCPTPGCGKPLTRIASKKKPGKFFWACSSPRDSECSYTAYDDGENKVPVHDTAAFWAEKREIEKKKFSNDDGTPLFPCPKCGGHLLQRKSKKDNLFWACAEPAETCDFSTWNKKDNTPEMEPEKAREESQRKREALIQENSNPDGSPKWPCGKCGGHLIRKPTKKDPTRSWFGCVNYPKCKQSYFEGDDGEPNYDDSGKGGKKRTKKKKLKPSSKVAKALGR